MFFLKYTLKQVILNIYIFKFLAFYSDVKNNPR